MVKIKALVSMSCLGKCSKQAPRRFALREVPLLNKLFGTYIKRNKAQIKRVYLEALYGDTQGAHQPSAVPRVSTDRGPWGYL